MQSSEHRSASRSEVRGSDRLSPAWLAAGSALFFATLAAPVAVVHMGAETPVGPPSPQAADSTKVVRSEDRSRASGEETVALREILEAGPIVPGAQVGGVSLGDEVDAVVAAITEPATMSFDVRDAELVQTHDYALENFHITLHSDPEIGRIDALSIAANSCAEVLAFQPRQDGLPATEDGLTIGSHVSRVVKRMGRPENEAIGEAAPQQPASHVAHTYPGMTVRYCAEDMIVGEISIVRLPDAPIDHVPLIAHAAPDDLAPVQPMQDSADQLSVATMSAPERAAPPEIEPELATVVPALTPGLEDLKYMTASHAPEALHIAELAPVRQDPAPAVDTAQDMPERADNPPAPESQPNVPQVPVQSTIAAPATAPEDTVRTPDPLLALQGGAYAVTDAFSAELARLSDPIVARAPDQLPDADDPTPPDPAMPAQFAMVTEEALALSGRDRREVQIRLSLLRHDPKGADGIFGPNTRSAIMAMQRAADLPETGFLDARAVDFLARETDRSYRRWARAEAQRRSRRARAREATVLVRAKVPAARNAPACVRDTSGQIIQNQSLDCDGSLLTEGWEDTKQQFSELFGRARPRSGPSG